MPEELARAVGAESPRVIMIAGKECRPKPISVKGLTEIERDCLDRYKRQYLETMFSNADLLPEDRRLGLIERKLEEVSRWDIDNLPFRYAHDPQRIVLTDGLKAWVCKNWSIPGTIDDIRAQLLTVAALDQSTLSEAEYRELTGSGVPKVKVPYVHWWITGTFDSMVTLIWTSFKHSGVTREQVVDSLGDNLKLLNELAREVEQLSAPQAGNG